MKIVGETDKEYFQRRKKELKLLTGVNMSSRIYDREILLSEYDLYTYAQLLDIEGLTSSGVMRALAHGNGEFEAKNYGIVAVQNYTAVELSRCTLRPLVLKRLLTPFMFSSSGWNDQNKPGLHNFEKMHELGIDTATKYRKVARILGLAENHQSSISAILTEIKHRRFDITTGKLRSRV